MSYTSEYWHVRKNIPEKEKENIKAMVGGGAYCMAGAGWRKEKAAENGRNRI